MNNEQFIILAKQVIENYYSQEGEKVEDLKISLIDTAAIGQTRKGLFAANKNENHLFEVTVNLETKKAFLGAYNFVRGITFDINFNDNKQEEKDSEEKDGDK